MVLVLAVPQAVDLVGNLHPLGNRRHSLAPPPPPLRLPTPLWAAAAAAKVQAMVDISLPHDGRQVVLIPFLHVRKVVLTYSLVFSGGPRPGSDGEWTPSWRGLNPRRPPPPLGLLSPKPPPPLELPSPTPLPPPPLPLGLPSSSLTPPTPPRRRRSGIKFRRRQQRRGEEQRRTPRRPGRNRPRVQGDGR